MCVNFAKHQQLTYHFRETPDNFINI